MQRLRSVTEDGTDRGRRRIGHRSLRGPRESMSEHNIIAFKAELVRSAFALHCSLLCVAIICHIVSWTLLDQFRSGAVFNILATILLLSGRI